MVAFASISAGLGRFARGALDVVLPPACTACGARTAEPHALCPTCWSGLTPIARPACDKLALPFARDVGAGALSPEAIADPPPWARGRAAVLFDGVGRDLVHRLKYGDDHAVAPVMARMTAAAGADLLSEPATLVPVPLHPRRLLARRFNQAALLAERIGRASGRAVAPLALTRVKPTTTQVGLTADQRTENLRGAFAVRDRAAIEGRRIVLVDDVLTTGATLKSATKALLKAGAAGVDVLVFARAGRILEG